MNEDDGNSRRMILAASLCLGLALVWPLIFPPQFGPSSQPASRGGPSQPAGPLATEEGPGRRPVRTATTGAVAEEETSGIDAEVFKFAGSVPVDGRMLPFEARLTNVGGAFDGFELLSYFERSSSNRATSRNISLSDSVDELPIDSFRFGQMGGIEFVGGTTFDFPRRPVYEVAEKSESKVRYKLTTGEKIVVEREYEFSKDRFMVEMAVTVRNLGEREHLHQLSIGTALAANEAMKRGGGFFSAFVPPADHLEAVCHAAGSVERENINSFDEGQVERFEEPIRWVAVDRQYFLAAIVGRDEGRAEARCELAGKGDTARARMVMAPSRLGPGQEQRYLFTAYLGVKVPQLLQAVEPELSGAINYTVLGLNLAPLCEGLLWVLGLIHDLTGSWGLAIIGLTVLVKGILFPLNQRQGKSMRAMSALRPQMEKIKELYPEDRQRQSEEMMRLYRENNVNPVGGCLPVLVQMPIWIALYRSLWVSVDLYQEQFLWLEDLTTRDPYFVLPITLMVVMFIQQKMMPAAMDAMQQKIMLYTMPLMFGFFMSALPSGLCFYILVNTLLTIVQQYLINRTVGPPTGASQPAVRGAAT